MYSLPGRRPSPPRRSDTNPIDGAWTRVGLESARQISERFFTFKDFAQSLAFASKVGAVARAEGHHPDLYVAWGKCKVEIWTHKINGLTESDFYLAAKTDREFEPFGPLPVDHGEARRERHRGGS